MFCTKCGKELRDGAVFCVHCGAPVKNNGGEAQEINVPSPAVSPDHVETVVKQENKTNAKKPKIMPIVLIVLAVLFIVAIVFGIIYFLDHRESKEGHDDSSAITGQASFAEENADDELMETSEAEPEKLEETQEMTETEPDHSTENVTDGPKQPGTVVLDSSSDISDIADSKDSSSGPKEETEEESADNQEDDYLLPGSDSAFITMADLKGFSAEECRIARNEIYARHGRKFKDKELQAYFDSKDWYHGTIEPDSFKEDMLNEYELANRDLIVEFEKKSGYR